MNTDFIKSMLKALLPPVLWSGLRKILPVGRGRIRFRGDYRNWESALLASNGYAAGNILETTRLAMQKIKRGEATYERDSVIFEKPQTPFPLICGLLRSATHSNGQLNVLDFGGALGSSYFQCRAFLNGIANLRWNVVEQPAHVACGRAEFSDEYLRFYTTVQECLLSEKPNVLLLSSVLQYLKEPYKFLINILEYHIPYVVIDRTAFLDLDRDRLTVQEVPTEIYSASYPAWFLSKKRFLACFEKNYRLVCCFPVPEQTRPDGGQAFHEGFIFELRERET